MKTKAERDTYIRKLSRAGVGPLSIAVRTDTDYSIVKRVLRIGEDPADVDYALDPDANFFRGRLYGGS